MSGILSIAVSGMNEAVARATQSTQNVVNASSTGKNMDEDLVNLTVAKTDYAVNAKVVQIAQKMQKALLDIEV